MEELNIFRINNTITFSEQEKTIMGIILILIDKENPRKKIKFKINTIKEPLKMEKYEVLKIFKSLSQKTLEINVENKIIFANLFESISYDIENKEVEIIFNEFKSGFFKKIKGIYDDSNKFKGESLKGKYSLIIYEMLKNSVGEDTYYTSIDYLRKLLRIDKTQYKLYADFKRKVILYSQKELNEKTDLNFEFEEKKENKKTIGLYFRVNKK